MIPGKFDFKTSTYNPKGVSATAAITQSKLTQKIQEEILEGNYKIYNSTISRGTINFILQISGQNIPALALVTSPNKASGSQGQINFVSVYVYTQDSMEPTNRLDLKLDGMQDFLQKIRESLDSDEDDFPDDGDLVVMPPKDNDKPRGGVGKLQSLHMAV